MSQPQPPNPAQHPQRHRQHTHQLTGSWRNWKTKTKAVQRSRLPQPEPVVAPSPGRLQYERPSLSPQTCVGVDQPDVGRLAVWTFNSQLLSDFPQTSCSTWIHLQQQPNNITWSLWSQNTSRTLDHSGPSEDSHTFIIFIIVVIRSQHVSSHLDIKSQKKINSFWVCNSSHFQKQK